MGIRRTATLGAVVAAAVCARPAPASPGPSELRFAVSQGNKWGFVDGTGALVIPFQYDRAGAFHGGIGCGDGYYIDAAGKRLAPGFADTCSQASPEGVVPAPKPQTGFLDRTGAITALPAPKKHAITELFELHEGLARAYVADLGLWGYVNARGAWVIKPTLGQAPSADLEKQLAKCDADYDKLGDAPTAANDYARVTLGQRCAPLADEVARMKDSAREFSEGLAAVRMDGGWGYVGKDGATVIDGKWPGAPGPFVNGRARVQTPAGDTSQYIDRTGKVVIAGPFKDATDFQEGFALVTDAGGDHFIDVSGKPPFAPPAGSLTMSGFSGGLAAVKRTTQFFGYVDKTGAWAIQPWFTVAGPFADGYARVEFTDGKAAFDAIIDATGKPLWLSDGARPTFEKWASWKVGQPAPGTTAAAAPAAPVAPVAPTAGRFIADPTDKDAVRDTQTGLEWAAHDNGADIDADGAAAYAQAYRGGGHSDWRLPTADELAALAAQSFAHREPGDCTGGKSGYVITPLIHVSCGLAWSSTPSGDGVTGFGFISGTPRVSKRSEKKNYRALVVRRG